MWKLLCRLFQSKRTEDANMFYIWNQSFMLEQEYEDDSENIGDMT